MLYFFFILFDSIVSIGHPDRPDLPPVLAYAPELQWGIFERSREWRTAPIGMQLLMAMLATCAPVDCGVAHGRITVEDAAWVANVAEIEAVWITFRYKKVRNIIECPNANCNGVVVNK